MAGGDLGHRLQPALCVKLFARDRHGHWIIAVMAAALGASQLRRSISLNTAERRITSCFVPSGRVGKAWLPWTQGLHRNSV